MALKKMQNRLGIKLQSIDLPNTTSVIRVDTDSLNDLKERITNRINFKELNSLLGLTYMTAVKFRNEGCFPGDTRTIWDGRSDITYELDEIQKLLAEFNSLAICTNNVNNKQLTHIYNIFQTFCCQDFTHKELLEAIKNKKIKLYSDLSNGNFKNYYIEKEEIIAELLKQFIPEGNDLLSFNAALEKYNISVYTLRKLLKEKRVESKKIRFGSRCHLLLFEKSLQNYLVSVILQLQHNQSFHLSRKESDMVQNWIQFKDGLTLSEFLGSYGTEAQCIAALEKMCWPQGYVCPKCESKSHCIVCRGKNKSFQCNSCHAQMNLTSKTIFNSTKLPLTTWFKAIYFISQTQGNISTHELTRILGVSYTTALRMNRKIIQVIYERDHVTTLAGRVEIDDD
jgi:transposase-like protein